MNASARRACKSLVDGYVAVEVNAREINSNAVALLAEEKNLRRNQRRVGEAIRGMGGGDMLDAALADLDVAA